MNSQQIGIGLFIFPAFSAIARSKQASVLFIVAKKEEKKDKGRWLKSSKIYADFYPAGPTGNRLGVR
jgi:hypothetical protein